MWQQMGSGSSGSGLRVGRFGGSFALQCVRLRVCGPEVGLGGSWASTGLKTRFLGQVGGGPWGSGLRVGRFGVPLPSSAFVCGFAVPKVGSVGWRASTGLEMRFLGQGGGSSRPERMMRARARAHMHACARARVDPSQRHVKILDAIRAPQARVYAHYLDLRESHITRARACEVGLSAGRLVGQLVDPPKRFPWRCRKGRTCRPRKKPDWTACFRVLDGLIWMALAGPIVIVGMAIGWEICGRWTGKIGGLAGSKGVVGWGDRRVFRGFSGGFFRWDCGVSMCGCVSRCVSLASSCRPRSPVWPTAGLSASPWTRPTLCTCRCDLYGQIFLLLRRRFTTSTCDELAQRRFADREFRIIILANDRTDALGGDLWR